jgi:hypothetical protein
MNMKRVKYWRSASVGYSQEDWQLLVAIAEHHDRFTKTVASELMSEAIHAEAIALGIIEGEDNTRDDDYFLSQMEKHEGAVL